MNPDHQKQLFSTSDQTSDDDLQKILDDIAMNSIATSSIMPASVDIDSINDNFDINALIDIPTPEIEQLLPINNQFLFDEPSNSSDVLSHESGPSEHFYQSQFTENKDSVNFIEEQLLRSQMSHDSFGYAPEEPNVAANSYSAQVIVQQQQRLLKAAARSKKSKNSGQPSTTTVEPIEYFINSNGCQPCTTAQMYNDSTYQQQLREYENAQSKKIRIKCQPRSKYRPRTQNESKNSAHYVRCEEGVRPEYPTILLPQEWNFQSDMNLIEVALMGIDKQPHPYTINNKNCSNTFEDNTLIFRQNEPNVIYFRLTDEDFRNGYKTFMVEVIKSKQDHIITKELIRSRELERSMLRFTRIFQIGKGQYERDEGSIEYSCVMSEAYGDIEVEHIGPRYGPMCGQEMVYIVLKGRVLKTDLKITIVEPFTNWQHSVENFTKNGNIMYFMMPAFPIQQCDSAKVEIIVFYKSDELCRTPFLYKGSLDQELANLHLNDSSTTTAASSAVTNDFNAFDFLTETGLCSNIFAKKKPTNKPTKRLKKM